MNSAQTLAQPFPDIPDEILNLIFCHLDSDTYIRWHLTTQGRYLLLGDPVSLKTSREIIAATGTQPLNVKEFFHAMSTKNDEQCQHAFAADQTIGLYYVNIREPITDDQHFAFTQRTRTLYLTRDSAKKNYINYSSAISFSIFKLPLNKINYRNLCENQSIEYTDNIDKQAITYMPKI